MNKPTEEPTNKSNNQQTNKTMNHQTNQNNEPTKKKTQQTNQSINQQTNEQTKPKRHQHLDLDVIFFTTCSSQLGTFSHVFVYSPRRNWY